MAESVEEQPPFGGQALMASDLVRALADDIEAREDDEDWEMEDWSKRHILSQLRGLPAVAAATANDTKAFLRFQDIASGAIYEAVALSRGVEAGVLSDGTVALLEFDLTDESAWRRLAAVVGFDNLQAATAALLSQAQARKVEEEDAAPPSPKRQRCWQ